MFVVYCVCIFDLGLEAEYKKDIGSLDGSHSTILFDLGTVYNIPDGKATHDDDVVLQFIAIFPEIPAQVVLLNSCTNRKKDKHYY